MELQLPQINALSGFFEGRTAGREVKRQKTLADHFGAASQGDQGALSQVMGVDPDAGMKAQAHAGQLKQEAAQQLVQQAKWFTQAPETMKPQLYASLVKTAHAAGMDYIPEAYDPQFAKGIEQLAGVGGGEQFTLSPGSKRFGPDGKVIAEVPFAPANTNLVSVPDGQGGTIQMIYDPRTQQFAKPNYGGQSMPAPTTGGGGQVLRDAVNGQLDPVKDFPALSGQFPGVQVSSLARDPGHNAKVGGQPNSFHLTGEAGDFVVPANQRPAFIAAARARGYQVKDEGDHVHLEPPRRGMTASHFGAGQQLGYTPPKSQTKETDLERRIAMARSMGASEDEIKRLVLGQSAPSTRDALGGKPLTQGTVNQLAKDAGRLTNLQNLAGAFVDDFAGNKITGATENYLGRLGLPLATKGQAEWWQQYDRMKNEVRNELFGASLTEGEKAAFEAADIAPNMSPDVIRKNLAAQQRIIQQGLERKAKTWAAQGYNRDAIREVTGLDFASPQQTKRKPTSDIDALLDKYK